MAVTRFSNLAKNKILAESTLTYNILIKFADTFKYGGLAAIQIKVIFLSKLMIKIQIGCLTSFRKLERKPIGS